MSHEKGDLHGGEASAPTAGPYDAAPPPYNPAPDQGVRVWGKKSKRSLIVLRSSGSARGGDRSARVRGHRPTYGSAAASLRAAARAAGPAPPGLPAAAAASAGQRQRDGAARGRARTRGNADAKGKLFFPGSFCINVIFFKKRFPPFRTVLRAWNTLPSSSSSSSSKRLRRWNSLLDGKRRTKYETSKGG